MKGPQPTRAARRILNETSDRASRLAWESAWGRFFQQLEDGEIVEDDQ